MSGVGPIEFVIVVTVMVMLFGPTLLAFWLGFTLGRKKGPAAEKPAPPAPAPPAEAPPAPETTPEQEHSDD